MKKGIEGTKCLVEISRRHARIGLALLQFKYPTGEIAVDHLSSFIRSDVYLAVGLNRFVPLLFLGPTLALGAAILRYRLFDIEIILRRSLIYGSLTAIDVSMKPTFDRLANSRRARSTV